MRCQSLALPVPIGGKHFPGHAPSERSATARSGPGDKVAKARRADAARRGRSLPSLSEAGQDSCSLSSAPTLWTGRAHP
ncbi:unnamed protein product [Caretta caretta]